MPYPRSKTFEREKEGGSWRNGEGGRELEEGRWIRREGVEGREGGRRRGREGEMGERYESERTVRERKIKVRQTIMMHRG